MAVGVASSTKTVLEEINKIDKVQIRRIALPVLISLGLIPIGMIAFHRALLSAWYTDTGALEMAKVELADFPTGSWDESKRADLHSPAESLFN
jgi:nitric oxide synthase oxygenase domain/subunit